MRLKIFFLCFTILLFISGCTKSENLDTNPYLSIINHLTSEEMMGRLPGTTGNKKAQEYIKTQFTSIGLEPVFNESYMHPYTHTFYNPEKQNIKMSLVKDSEEINLVYEKDFVVQNSVKDLQIQLPICAQKEELINEDCLFVTQDKYPLNNEHIKGILKQSPILSKHLPSGFGGIPIIQIQEDIYKKILEKGVDLIQQVNLNMQLISEDIEANNIVGKIAGKGHGDHKDAVIISAHFDSLGSMDGNYFEGAIDNASGVAGLIQLAINLKQHSLKEEFQSDIILVAFNGEESGLQGSEAFVKDIAKNYKNISNINIDSVGDKNDDEYVIVNADNGKVLRDRLVDYLSSNEFKITEENPSLTSDHVSFSKYNYPAITIGQNNLDTIHTLDDTRDLIDHIKLHEIVTGIFNYIVNTEKVDLEITQEPSEMTEEEIAIMDELIEVATEEAEKLEFGQYKVVSIPEDDKENAQSILASNTHISFTSVSAIPNNINWLIIPEVLDVYTFSEGEISFTITPDNYNSLEKDKIYEIDKFSKEDLNSLYLTYLDSSKEGYEILISTMPFQNNDKNRLSTYKGHEYTIYDSSFLNIHTTRTFDNKTYYYSISKIKQNDFGENILLWKTDEGEQAIKTIDSINLETLTQDMGL
ncbi:M28 family metallopeptidase [Psychrobacillus sp. FJAT-21963]|uniref:M28 family metallopeptidase n=1 Tax=Psychrobacillus sp. FJAT-21963 TaxID=1712028 RepID=UPI0006FFCC5D|nr:M28 family metallopeptidase [Psychrobacillus sp. FJAT-21963]KQL34411.1 hypothetical protein AN959_15550 [Psychrobacillus sp. FJAT-21963]